MSSSKEYFCTWCDGSIWWAKEPDFGAICPDCGNSVGDYKAIPGFVRIFRSYGWHTIWNAVLGEEDYVFSVSQNNSTNWPSTG